MSIHIGDVRSEVIPQPDAPEAESGATPPAMEAGRVAQMISGMLRDRMRTAAEGFDD